MKNEAVKVMKVMLLFFVGAGLFCLVMEGVMECSRSEPAPRTVAPAARYYPPLEQEYEYQRTVEGAYNRLPVDPLGIFGPPTQERGTIRIKRLP